MLLHQQRVRPCSCFVQTENKLLIYMGLLGLKEHTQNFTISLKRRLSTAIIHFNTKEMLILSCLLSFFHASSQIYYKSYSGNHAVTSAWSIINTHSLYIWSDEFQNNIMLYEWLLEARWNANYIERVLTIRSHALHMQVCRQVSIENLQPALHMRCTQRQCIFQNPQVCIKTLIDTFLKAKRVIASSVSMTCTITCKVFN